MDRIPIKINPRLFDKAVVPIQRALGNRLAWLDHSFGIAEFLTDVKNQKKFDSANLYVGDEQYAQIMPCDEIGNFSFFILRDPQTVNRSARRIISPISLIVWYKMTDVSILPDERNREVVKAQILAVLDAMHNPYFEMQRIYENPKNVFSDFSYDYTENQFLMHPYAGLRIDGEITATIPCIREFRSFDESYDDSYD